MAETLDFYEDIMDMFEVLGLKAIDPLVEEERHDDTMGKVEVYMHGRLVEMTGSASSPPQVTAFTSPLDDASASVENIFLGKTVRFHPLACAIGVARVRRPSAASQPKSTPPQRRRASARAGSTASGASGRTSSRRGGASEWRVGGARDKRRG